MRILDDGGRRAVGDGVNDVGGAACDVDTKSGPGKDPA